jgi:2-succinyl-6-hydroxy-2,4-cyclohexadiene-1-carboxylate synthase
MGQGAQPSFWERLGELRGLVLLIVGEEDEKYAAIARAMTERIPEARVEVVAEAGHAAYLEAPGPTGRVVVELLRSAE